jgi:hypothetical protein
MGVQRACTTSFTMGRVGRLAAEAGLGLRSHLAHTVQDTMTSPLCVCRGADGH